MNKSTESSGEVKSSKLRQHYAKSVNAKQRIVIEWKDLSYSILSKDPIKSKPFFPVYKNKRVLRSLSGRVVSGELLAIMGPTGTSFSAVIFVLVIFLGL
jgi:ABC-type multidrug transport system ATPase subunit